MKRRTWLALGICGVSVLLAGEPICKRFVWHVPVHHRPAKKLDHKPSPKTIARWKAWDKAKSLREYDLACGPLATQDASIDWTLPEIDLPFWTVADQAPVAYEDEATTSTIDGSAEGLEAPTVGYTLTSYPLPWPPIPYLMIVPPWLPPAHRIGPGKKHPGQPVAPPVTVPVPEPDSIWLMLAGVAGVFFKKRRS